MTTKQKDNKLSLDYCQNNKYKNIDNYKSKEAFYDDIDAQAQAQKQVEDAIAQIAALALGDFKYVSQVESFWELDIDKILELAQQAKDNYDKFKTLNKKLRG